MTKTKKKKNNLQSQRKKIFSTEIILNSLSIFRVDVWCAGRLAQDESPPTLSSRYEKKKVNYLRLLSKLVPLIIQNFCKEKKIYAFLHLKDNKSFSFIRITKPNPPISRL